MNWNCCEEERNTAVVRGRKYGMEINIDKFLRDENIK